LFSWEMGRRGDARTSIVKRGEKKKQNVVKGTFDEGKKAQERRSLCPPVPATLKKARISKKKRGKEAAGGALGIAKRRTMVFGTSEIVTKKRGRRREGKKGKPYSKKHYITQLARKKSPNRKRSRTSDPATREQGGKKKKPGPICGPRGGCGKDHDSYLAACRENREGRENELLNPH